jgi:hypothetical protein
MVTKTINKDKLKVKYVIGSYTVLPRYPDAGDVFYEFFTNYCSRKGDRRIKFTTSSMEKKWPTMSKERMGEIAEYLIDHNLIEEVSKTPSYSTYRIISNPYE